MCLGWVPGWVMCGVSSLGMGLLSIPMAGFWWAMAIRGLRRRVWVGWRVRVAMVGCSVRGGLGLTVVMVGRRAGLATVVLEVRVLTGLVAVRGVLGAWVGCLSATEVMVVLVVRHWRQVGMGAPVVMGAARGCCRCGVPAVPVVMVALVVRAPQVNQGRPLVRMAGTGPLAALAALGVLVVMAVG